MTSTLSVVTRVSVMLATAACAQSPEPTSAERNTAITATAVVESIDLETRQVGLRSADGELIEVVAGPEVRNLQHLVPGDRARFDYYRSVAVQMAEATDPGAPTGTVASQRAAEGEMPGGVLATTTSEVVEVVDYDPAAALALVRLHDGATRSIVVQPELQAFAAARQPGDRVLVTITESLAVSIVPRRGRTGADGR